MKNRKIDKELLSELGYQDLGEQEEKELLAKLSLILESRMAMRVAGELPEDQHEAFVKLQDSGASDQEIVNWLEEKVPNQENMVQEELEDMVTDLLYTRDRTLEIADELRQFEDTEEAKEKK